MRRLELEILFWCTRAALILILPPYISDLGLYEDYAKKMLVEGQIPYQHFDFEYPPFALPFILLPQLGQKLAGFTSTETYRVFFSLLMLPFDAFLFYSFRRRPPFSGAAFAYVMLTCAMGLLLFDRFDLAVGFVLAFPFLRPEFFSDRRYGLSAGLGAALKIVPLLLAPLLVFRWEKPSLRRFIVYSLYVTLPLFLACAGAWLLSGGKISFLQHHSSRGVQIESLIASFLMAAQSFFHLVNTAVDTNFGAQHLGDIKGVVPASRILFFGTLVFTYFFVWWERSIRNTLTGAWLILSGFVTFGYVLSPQFLLWLIPLGLVAAGQVPVGWKRHAWLLLFTLVIVATGSHFRFYWDYVNLKYLSVAAVLGRNCGLVLLWILSWAWMKTPNMPELRGKNPELPVNS